MCIYVCIHVSLCVCVCVCVRVCVFPKECSDFDLPSFSTCSFSLSVCVCTFYIDIIIICTITFAVDQWYPYADEL